MHNSGKLSLTVQEKLNEAISRGLQAYLAVPVDKRQELESQGMNLSSAIYEHILPVITQTQVHSLLIIMEEGIGNMVMLTPTIKLLKNTHPLLKIAVWCKEPAAQVIRGWELVDKVITNYDGGFYDLAFLTIWSQNTATNFEGVLKNRCKATMQVNLRTFHESIQHAGIADFLGASTAMCLPHCQVATGEEAKFVDIGLRASTDLDSDLNIQPYICFGDTTLRIPGWEVKRWPYYVELAEKIYKKFPQYRIVLIGDKEDLEEARTKKWPGNVTLNMMGVLNIPQLAYLLKGAEMYIGNDTGPTHIAAAVGTKTFAIFAPTMVSKNKPIGPNVTIINKRFACSPCQYTERFAICECIKEITADYVYDLIFHPEGNKDKRTKVMLVGDFSGGALRNEIYIKSTLEKEFHCKVIPFEYRVYQKKTNPVDATYELFNQAMHHEPDMVLICGGQNIVPEVLMHFNFFLPRTKLINWYVDCRNEVEPWFRLLSSVCHKSYWSTGSPDLLSQVFSQTQRPCEFLPIVPDDKEFYPMDLEKTIDVLFVGTPHSKPRIQLLEYLVDNGIKPTIYGQGNWPDKLKPYAKPGVFGKDFVKLLNRAKIVLNTNVINTVPLYFSDRVFQPMSVKTVGLNQYIPNLEDMFEDGKHMRFFKTHEECLIGIKELLGDKELRKTISEEGYKLYKEKYTLKHILQRVFD